MINNKQNDIPIDWQKVALIELGDFFKGSGITKDQLVIKGHNAVRYGELYTRFDGKIQKIFSHIANEALSEATQIKYGDILFAGSGETIDEIGKSAAYLLKEPCFAGGDIIIFRPKNQDSLFLSYFLNVGLARKRLRELGQGQSVVHLYKRDLEKLHLPLPPLPEQRRIVSVLETWDSAIEKLARKIEIKKNIKKGLMQKLLTGKMRLPGFSGEWKKVEIGDVATLRKDNFNPKESKTRQDFCIELEHIGQETGELINHTSTTSRSSIKSVFLSGDILFGKLRAYLRKYWFADRDGVCSSEIWVIRPKGNIIYSKFLYNIIISERFLNVATTAHGTHMPRSDWKVVSGFNFEIPNFEEQKAIASVLTGIENEIFILKRKVKVLKEQKKYLLNNLVTGCIRVPLN